MLDERLGAPEDAIRQLERVIAELDPTDLDAHTMLRRLHEARGDFEAAVRIAEREMYLAAEPSAKVVRALEIGLICRDRLEQPARALQAFERVLDDRSAPRRGAGRRRRSARAPRRLEGRRAGARAPPRPDRGRPGPPHPARPPRRAHRREARRSQGRLPLLAPRARRGARRHHARRAQRAAEAYGLWRELAEVWSDERRRLLTAGGGGVPSDVDAYVAASRELAQVCERRLSDRARAMTALHEALAVAPRDGGLLAEVERLAAEADQKPLWKQLTDGYDLALRAAPAAARVELHQKKARVLDERLADPKGAVAELLAAFAWAPEREDLRAGMYKLAEKNRTWDDVIAVETALVERADGADRLAALRRKAQVIEEQLKDLPRAFRVHLVSFLLAPEDADTLAHLWRLARAIGRYREVDRTPKPEPAPATVHGERDTDAPAPVPVARISPVASGPTRPRRPSTEELGDSDLRRLPGAGNAPSPVIASDIRRGQPVGRRLDPADRSRRADAGQSRRHRRPAAGEAGRRRARVDDRAVAPRAQRPHDGARHRGSGVGQRPASAGAHAGRAELARAARRRLGSHQAAAAAAAHAQDRAPPRWHRWRPAHAAAAGAGAQGAGLGAEPPLPQLPHRAYESPWEELAAAYESLPAPDPQARLRWLYRAAEVWETGGKDIPRAFDTLARAFERVGRTTGGPARRHRRRGPRPPAPHRRRSTRRGIASPSSTRRWPRRPTPPRPPPIC